MHVRMRLKTSGKSSLSNGLEIIFFFFPTKILSLIDYAALKKKPWKKSLKSNRLT